MLLVTLGQSKYFPIRKKDNAHPERCFLFQLKMSARLNRHSGLVLESHPSPLPCLSEYHWLAFRCGLGLQRPYLSSSSFHAQVLNLTRWPVVGP